MRTSISIALVIFAYISTTLATLVLDLEAPFQNFTCFKSPGYSFVIVKGYKSHGSVDTEGYQNLMNTKAAGLISDVYFLPCKRSIFQLLCFAKRSSIYYQQERVFMLSVFTQYISIFGSEYGTVWIGVEYNPYPWCEQNLSDYSENCLFFQDIVNLFTAKKRLVGIYSSQYQWSKFMGSASACAKFTSHPLWYAHKDYNLSFSDYAKQAFGGWTKPSIKQYNHYSNVCYVGEGLNFY